VAPVLDPGAPAGFLRSRLTGADCHGSGRAIAAVACG